MGGETLPIIYTSDGIYNSFITYYSMRKIVSKWEIKKARYIKELWDLDVRKAPVIEWIELEPYIVRINGSEEQYQYCDGKLYLDEKNNELCNKEIAEHQKVMKLMEEEWKTTEEINEYMKWKGTDYIDRVERVMDCEWLYKRIDILISCL